MKKILLLLVIGLMPINVFASVVVMDMDTNRVLYGVNEKESKLIASTTKIMTAIVVINNVSLTDVVKVNESVLKSYGSGIYIEVGEEITVENLLYGLMLRSGNDAAIALAEYVGGSMEGFVTLMNEMASSLNMYDTKFINASGLEDESGNGNMSTAEDMGKLMSYAMQNETFKKITSTKHHIAKTNYKTYDWYNKNKLLSMYEYTTGGKTGYTEKAYRTLVTSATKDNKNLSIVTLNERDDFNIHQNLYEEYFSKYKLVKILDSKTFMQEESGMIEKDFSMLLTDDELKKVKVEVIKTEDITNRLGYVTVSLDDEIYFKEDIYEKGSDEEKETKELSFVEKIKSFFKNLLKK